MIVSSHYRRDFLIVSIAWILLVAKVTHGTKVRSADFIPPLLEQAEQHRHLAHQHQATVRDYYLWEAEEFQVKLLEWKKLYPDLVHVTTAQEKYGFPTAGTDADCPFYKDADGCPNYILHIQDFVVHPENTESSNALPEVFWSGCLHGNERVGPTATMEAATLLLEAAACEALPRPQNSDYSSSAADDTINGIPYASRADELKQAESCRKELRAKGIDDVHRRWLARLVTTRRLIITPTSNALGYFRNDREEGTIDPNRDFPYDVIDPKLCMQTIVGRTLNELFREHMFQLALTFHGGTEVVSYEWGAPTWLHFLSPDDAAQEEIAQAYSLYSGGFASTPAYDYGTMNDKVYYVRGGMEDWAYAGSFDPERVIICEPETFGPYSKDKTKYNNSTLRAFNMLVETSDNKAPHHHLGSSLDVLSKDTAGNGHVSRNIRLALMSVDMVEPYVSVVGVNQLALSDDLVPISSRKEIVCRKTRAVMVAKNAKEIEIQFTIGGALSIDSTNIWFAKWTDVQDGQVDCLKQPSELNGFTQGEMIGEEVGSGHFSSAGSYPSFDKTGGSHLRVATIGPIFRAKVQIPQGVAHLDELVIVASGRVDQNWQNRSQHGMPDMRPQSHIVNARTNPEWHHESAGKVVHGRVDWFSAPLTIVIGDFTDCADGLESVTAREMHPRFGHQGSGALPPSCGGKGKMAVENWQIVVLMLFGMTCCISFCSCLSCSKPRGRFDRTRQLAQGDDFVFDSKPYSDGAEGNGIDSLPIEHSDSEYGMELPDIS